MATDYERFLQDIKDGGFDGKSVEDIGQGERAQRAYIAFKLFQIEEHLRHAAGSDAKRRG
jgi:hypothetical protein